jgi:anion-transporting  ArsA/GET3 family ATPase
MEPYPYHYSHCPKVDDSSDLSIRSALEELQKMELRLTDTIEGRCSGLERYVMEVEHHSEERLVSLEMARTEVETGRTALEKHVDGLKLEVYRVNRFFKRETLAHPLDKHGIFHNSESAFASLGAANVDLDTHHAATTPHEREHGSVFTYTAGPLNGMSQPNSTCHVPLSGQRADSGHVG